MKKAMSMIAILLIGYACFGNDGCERYIKETCILDERQRLELGRNRVGKGFDASENLATILHISVEPTEELQHPITIRIESKPAKEWRTVLEVMRLNDWAYNVPASLSSVRVVYYNEPYKNAAPVYTTCEISYIRGEE
jgi:hypothetical protein